MKTRTRQVSPPNASTRKARSSRARDAIASLTELRDAFADGRQVTAREVRADLGPPFFDAAAVRSIRESLGASQAAFALFVGASTGTVSAWEQGRRSPSGIAARFLDEIRRKPCYFSDRLARAFLRRDVELRGPIDS